MPPLFKIPAEIVSHYNVTKVYKSYDRGQKYSFKVDCKYGLCMLKMLKYSYGELEERDKREINFYRSNQAAKGIPRIVDVAKIKSDWVILEECIQGNNLQEVRSEFLNNQLKIKNLVRQVIYIMTPFWEAEIVHRDLKPENIMVSLTGEIYIIDFGIYKNPNNSTITSTSFQPHSLYYAAPEQIFADKLSISYRTDFFSLGIIVYELSIGKHPFGETDDDRSFAYANKQKLQILNNEFGNFLDLCLQCDVSQRARSPQILLEALA